MTITAPDDAESSQTSTAEGPSPLETREIFLDTEVYRRLDYDLGKATAQALFEHVAADRLQLHITDITSSEIRRHIAADAAAAIHEIVAARRTMAKWRKRAPVVLGRDSKKLKLLDSAKAGAEAYAAFRGTLLQHGLMEHRASDQPGTAIFAAYFDRAPPFDAQGGKSVKEFPDAFVIEALAEWCLENNATMYVVTQDLAMLRAVRAKPQLRPLAGLNDLLEIATLDHSPDVEEMVEVIVEMFDFDDSLGLVLDQCIDELTAIYVGDELPEGEAGEVLRAGDPESISWTVISAGGSSYGLIVEFEVDLLVEVYFEDRSLASYDREDDLYIGAEPSSTQFEEMGVSLRMFVQLMEDGSITRSELLTREVNIHGRADGTY